MISTVRVAGPVGEPLGFHIVKDDELTSFTFQPRPAAPGNLPRITRMPRMPFPIRGIRVIRGKILLYGSEISNRIRK
jgi:hypothetical protein